MNRPLFYVRLKKIKYNDSQIDIDRKYPVYYIDVREQENYISNENVKLISMLNKNKELDEEDTDEIINKKNEAVDNLTVTWFLTVNKYGNFMWIDSDDCKIYKNLKKDNNSVVKLKKP
jgi:hypothetical protein